MLLCCCRCLPTGFISRDDINPVRNACLTAGRCTATTGSTNVNNAFDTSFYTGTQLVHLLLSPAARLQRLELWLACAVTVAC